MKEWKPTDLSLLAIDSQINWCVCSQAVTCRLFSLLKFKKKNGHIFTIFIIGKS